MSENWGADQIPRAAGRTNLVEALSSAQHMPAEAIEEALRRPQAVADEVLRIGARAGAGETIGEREQNLVFWGSHVLAQTRDRRLCGPLLAILKRADDTPLAIFGDVIDSTLRKLVISVFDGDAEGLEGALADRNADELVRWGLFAAYAFLVFDGRVPRERARAFLIRFDDERLARAGDAAWAGWEEAIALLGFRELEPRRAAAVADARLLTDEGDGADAFGAMLSLAESEPENAARFEARGLGYLDDAVAELEAALASDEEAPPEEPVHNPLRHVGRNDPCPCGSGRKYKKCCLGADAA